MTLTFLLYLPHNDTVNYACTGEYVYTKFEVSATTDIVKSQTQLRQTDGHACNLDLLTY